MAVNLSPYGGVGAQFLDNAGNVLTGGKIFTYAGGTTTPQATYTSSNGATPHPNPIILDAAGRVPGGEIWLTDGLVYKFILRDANDVLIATYDGITGINSNFVAFTNQQEIQTATAGQTVFNLTTMSYQPGTNSLSVFVDGVNQYGPGAQYAYLETDSDTVTFLSGLHVGAEVKFTTSQLNTSGSTNDAFQVSYVPPFTGSVATNVGDKLAQTVSVKDFGAVGDGVADDTAAFVAANNWLMNQPLPPTNQLVESQYVTMEIPQGMYKITGNRIFGSQIPTGSNGTTPPRIFQILGKGATLIWDVVNEDDELFYFDGTLSTMRVQGLSIFTTRSTILGTGAGVIFRFYSNLSLSNQANAQKFHLEDVQIWPGRRTSGGSFQRNKYVFLNTGNAACDTMLIEKCSFNYMQKVWVGQNDQAVNITFNSCSFAGLSNGSAMNTTYFDFTRMNDNFNVVNSSFSVQSGETLIKTNSPISGGFYVETAGYNFNFDNNRIEIILGSGSNVSWNLCDMNFGKLNFKNTNLNLGSGTSTVKTVVRAYQLANLNFDNVSFNAANFYFPASTSASFGGSLNPYGVYFTNCILNDIGTNTTYAYTDGVTDYSIQTILSGNGPVWRSARFENCGFINQNGFVSWSFAAPSAAVSNIERRKGDSFTYSVGGIAFGKPLRLPPYQVIKKITLNMAGTLPNTFDAFRVWIGDRTLANTYDVDNIRPDIRKNDYTLFEGNAAVFYADRTLQSIEVALIDGGVESNSVLSEITVEYTSMDARALNITTNADQLRTFRANRSVSSGTTAQRPNIDLFVNQQYFDTTLGKPIWWNGSVWKDAAGTTVQLRNN